MARIGIILCALFLAGCQSVANSIKPADLNRIDRVGIVSLVDDKIEYTYMGVTLFNNEFDTYSLDGWEIDDFISNAMQREIRDYTDIETEVIHAEDVWLESLYDDNDKYDFSVPERLPLLRQIAEETGQRYLVVFHRVATQFSPDVPLSVKGFGLQRQYGYEAVGTYAIIEAKLIDVVNGRVLSRMFTPSIDQASGLAWQANFEELESAKQDKIKVYFEKSILVWLPIMAKALFVPSEG